MSQKYTWSEREISKGNRECIIGLLEDMHILFDGHPPRKAGPNYFENGPHIGRVYDQIQRQPFYYHSDQQDDTFELEHSSSDVHYNSNVRDYVGANKNKQSKDLPVVQFVSKDAQISKNESKKQLMSEIESNGNMR